MKFFFFLFLLFCLSSSAYNQELIFIKDSIMNAYMKSGFATKHFRPNGKFDSNNKREGKWLDYEAIEEGSFQTHDNAPLKTTSVYLLYGEGEFKNGERIGDWNIYVIQDKTLKRFLSKKVAYKEGKPEGPFKYFYPNGSLAQTGFYNKGKIEGPSNMYYENGKIFASQTFVNNKKNGEQKYFFPSQKLKFIMNYADGVREGKYESYYENGNIEEAFNYKKDSIDGIYRYYYSTGQLWTEKFYNNGALLNAISAYDKNGKELDKGSLKDGNGTVNYYTEDGKIYLRVTYKDGRQIKEESFK